MIYSLTYIHHDCFLLRLPGMALVFDYFADADGSPARFPGFLDSLHPDEPLYVFVSHFHKDHYSPDIFAWSMRHPCVHYIISRDVERHARHILRPDTRYNGPRPPFGSVTALRPGESFSDGKLDIRAFDSTDTGNSYLVTYEGHNFFHAGDLNAWIWKDESTPQEVNKALGDYRHILNQIAMAAPRMELCMFPVDSRIGTDYFTGARMLLETIDVACFVPMHFCLGNDASERMRLQRDALNFDAYANTSRGEYIGLTGGYSRFIRNV